MATIKYTESSGLNYLLCPGETTKQQAQDNKVYF